MKIMIMSDVVPPASERNEYTDGAIEKLVSYEFRKKLQEAVNQYEALSSLSQLLFSS